MLIKRIISSILLILFVAGIVFVKELSGLAVIAFIVVGLYEFFTMLEKKGIMVYKYFGIGIGAIIPISIMQGLN